MSTLTYVYEDSTAVLGPLAARSEPHSYDLCRDHGSRLTAPRGWRLLRIPGGTDAGDDLTALAQALDDHPDTPDETAVLPPSRRGTDLRTGPRPGSRSTERPGSTTGPAGRHLHVVRSADDPADS